MGKILFDYYEALLGLGTIAAWADGKKQDSEIDASVSMLMNENVPQSSIRSFKKKYDLLQEIEYIYELSVDALLKEDERRRARALSWMWQIANVSDEEDEDKYSFLEDEVQWRNAVDHVDLNEIKWINKAKKDLKVSLELFKQEFANLPETKRI
jgi:hypothetical protein